MKLIGLGQRLRGDDGLGLAVVEAWQKTNPDPSPRVEVCSFESPGIALLDELKTCPAVLIVDAVRSGGRPGEIYRLDQNDLFSFGPAAASAHGIGVAETLALGRSLYPGQMPGLIQFIGIEAGSVQVGQPLSQAGRAAIPKAVQLIELVLEEMRQELVLE
jgi:hydrogenase maturation protease